ncbi:hypothetical protein GCM10011387_06870 [Pedobacter quisquiliarum]|jgi:hypothetical protein|uniref:DUF2007 domain-containing protein n=1 Tax=Pedobacter quisquiliarum TaxID=1834438 RepID=A0A916U1J3_9SPHI|nr:DUF2007 domain-containing protein [Pedobacter quisquiliarum]GGC55924.1 hypothetical protein GCM10011387_06870 [Pedobacter quisquiliarum]
MENNWTKVYTTSNPITAEIIKQALVENDIPAVVMNKQDSSYKAFGVINILVQPENFDQALAYIIENNLNED